MRSPEGRERPRRFLISCGGTGGHLSPGIALAEALTEGGDDVTLLISRKRVDARLSEKYPSLQFERMPGLPFSWNPFKLARCLASQGGAVAFCLKVIARRRPDAIVGFGGFTSAPAVVAGALARIPVALHEANRRPGLAVRALARFADRVYLPQGIRIAGVNPSARCETGLPVRREIVRVPRAQACAALGLDPDRKVLVVLGGSQGASALNDWARAEAPALGAAGVQLYCLTGLGKGADETREFPVPSGSPVRVRFVAFSDRMADVLSAADLAVSRAGAGTIAELIRCEAPAILVPFPHAADDHQAANARFFERQGGGLVVPQEGLDRLRAEVLDTLFNDWLLRKFRGNLQRMDRANALDHLARDLRRLADGGIGGSTPALMPA